MASIINNHDQKQIPIIDIACLIDQNCQDKQFNMIATEIGNACRNVGFFCIINHGIPNKLIDDMQICAQSFFSQPKEIKEEVSMKYGGKAWRGWFPVGDELTSGRPDQKEGYYFGNEEDPAHSLPLHGCNIWPKQFPEMKGIVLEYMSKCVEIGKLLMKAICLALQIDVNVFNEQFHDPTTLFRMFNYPSHKDKDESGFPLFGVGEHTDYGYLTLLFQDNTGGLQVKPLSLNDEWIDVQPIPYSLIVNLGDALQHNTGGLLRATPHRVRHLNNPNPRLSFPFFFDPGFDAEMINISEFLNNELKLEAEKNRENDTRIRWDNENPEHFSGKYGAYLMRKVSKVFPELSQQYITSLTTSSSS